MDRINKLEQTIDINDLFDLYIMIDKYDLKLLFLYVNFEEEIIERLNYDNLQTIIDYINIVYEINILNEMNWQKIIFEILENKDKNLMLDFWDLHGIKYNYQNITTINDFEKLLYQYINNEYYLIYDLSFLAIYKNINLNINTSLVNIIICIFKSKYILKNYFYIIIKDLIEISSNYLNLLYVLILKEYFY